MNELHGNIHYSVLFDPLIILNNAQDISHNYITVYHQLSSHCSTGFALSDLLRSQLTGSSSNWFKTINTIPYDLVTPPRYI